MAKFDWRWASVVVALYAALTTGTSYTYVFVLKIYGVVWFLLLCVCFYKFSFFVVVWITSMQLPSTMFSILILCCVYIMRIISLHFLLFLLFVFCFLFFVFCFLFFVVVVVFFFFFSFYCCCCCWVYYYYYYYFVSNYGLLLLRLPVGLLTATSLLKCPRSFRDVQEDYHPVASCVSLRMPALRIRGRREDYRRNQQFARGGLFCFFHMPLLTDWGKNAQDFFFFCHFPPPMLSRGYMFCACDRIYSTGCSTTWNTNMILVRLRLSTKSRKSSCWWASFRLCKWVHHVITYFRMCSQDLYNICVWRGYNWNWKWFYLFLLGFLFKNRWQIQS